jgi:MoaD family protein
MAIKVKGYLIYNEIIGEQLISIKKGNSFTVLSLLNLLATELDQEFSHSIFDPQTNELQEYVAVIINGRSYANLPEELDTRLQDGDEVAIFPPMAGGSKRWFLSYH